VSATTTTTTPSKRYSTARAVVAAQTAGMMEGALLDTFTASALVGLYEALNTTNRERFDSIALDRLVNMAFTGGKK
jgi:hypothetical protein